MRSMTGFGSATVCISGRNWRWEARSVNSRGLDLRFRFTEGTERLEPELRAMAAKRISRGNVLISLRRDAEEAGAGLSVNEAALGDVIAAALRVEAAAGEAGLALQPAGPGEILMLRGVLENHAASAPDDETLAALKAGFASLLDDLDASRAAEAARLGEALLAQISDAERLTKAAAGCFDEYQDIARRRLQEKVADLLAAGVEAPPERIAQELAMLMVKSDIREELDRLTSHIGAARELLSADGPCGRKLDFLTQEFNREANTLCSKSASPALTELSLELKVVIDQMREQAQNIE